MRVVLDARVVTPHFPGIGRYTVELARALHRADPGLELTLLRDPRAGEELAGIQGSRLVDVAAGPFSLAQQWEVPARVRALEPDVYHSPMYSMPYRIGVPTVFTCYDLIPMVRPEYFPPSRRVLFRLFTRLAVAASRRVLSISEATKQDLCRLFRVSPSQVVVTHLAAADVFRPATDRQVAETRAKYGLGNAYFVAVGSNKPHKNLSMVIRAFADFRSGAGSSCQLAHVGPWDARYPEPREAANAIAADAVRFLGVVPDEDLAALYTGAVALLFPSLYEGFGLPVVEAMKCGTPVLCSDRSSVPEVAGDAAWVLDPTQTAEWCDAMRKVAENPALRSKLSQASVRRAAEFTWEETARRTLAVYREVAGAAA